MIVFFFMLILYHFKMEKSEAGLIVRKKNRVKKLGYSD